MATIQTISYSQNVGTILSRINTNIQTIESEATGLSKSTLVSNPSTYAELIAAINTSLEEVQLYSTGREKVHSDIAGTAGALITGLNTNFGVINEQSEDFLADDCQMFFEIKQLLDPEGDIVYILCHQDDYKFAANKLGDTLLFSDDCGATWGYTKAFADCFNIRMAHVFKNGNIIFATKEDNKVYFSDDNLATLDEITVYDTDGVTPLTFHTPEDPDYPGLYFGVLVPESWVIPSGDELFVFGCYWQPQDDTGAGAVPINIYMIKDDGSMRAIYKLGDNAEERDDGTAASGPTGNIVGDITNPVYCHHAHNTVYDANNNKWYILLGDNYTNDELWILEATYDSDTDAWNFTEHEMNSASDKVFRMAGARFTPDGNVIWTSDGEDKGGIYECTLANFTSPVLGNHTCLFRSTLDYPTSRGDCISLSEYGKHMMACRYGKVPAIICSDDYGVTWKEMPDNYTLLQADPYVWSQVRKFYNKDSQGFYLLVHSSLAGQCLARNCLVKPHDKP